MSWMRRCFSELPGRTKLSTSSVLFFSCSCTSSVWLSRQKWCMWGLRWLTSQKMYCLLFPTHIFFELANWDSPIFRPTCELCTFEDTVFVTDLRNRAAFRILTWEIILSQMSILLKRRYSILVFVHQKVSHSHNHLEE